MPRRIIISISVVFLLLLALAVGVVADKMARQNLPDVLSGSLPGLGDISFDLQASNGGNISNGDLLGRPTALFFGFTYCPEICPTTLLNLSDLVDEIGRSEIDATENGDLGVAGTDIQIVFITVDPERDTAPVLADYIDAIGEGAIGLTGSEDAIAEVLEGFGIYAVRVPLDDGDYTMDHTATVFLYDRAGDFSGTIAWGENEAQALAKLTNLAVF